MKLATINRTIRASVIYIVKKIFLEFAIILGYPERQGMLRYFSYNGPYFFKKQIERKEQFSVMMPFRKIPVPPKEEPFTLPQALFGCVPTAKPVEKFYIENKYEGYYAFMIKSHINLTFLPMKVSEFIQIRLNYCLDLTELELLRQGCFAAFMIFAEITTVRLFLGWILSINPYTFPWNLFISLVDWTEDVTQGIIPTVFGVNLSATALMVFIGFSADILNNLVFTMPYLPGEGDPQMTWLEGKTTYVWVYHFLPVLWYKYPIPNEIREYWYYDRPDILEYMQAAYNKLDIQFLPDQVVNFLNQHNSS